jgi:hypothetical protein
MRFFIKSKWMIVLEKLNFLTKQNLNIMEDLSSLSARVDKITGDIATIKTNVVAIRSALPPTGGLSEADVETLAAKLDAAVAVSDAEVTDTASAPASGSAPAAQ